MQQSVGRWTNRARAYLAAVRSEVRDRVRGRRDPLVPPRYRLYAGWRGDYGKVSGRWLLAAFDAGKLPRDGRVLDIGCGPGRIAARLARHLEGGSYEGFDIVPRSIEWCQRKISSRHPSFHFQVADIRSGQYNPAGSQEARTYTFPYADGEFDLALAASVFTHMRPGEIERYVSEAGRVLNPGGRLLASFFLLNEDAELQLSSSGRNPLGEEQRDNGIPYRSSDPATPEYMIALSEQDVRKIHEAAGLEVESIRYGKWCGRKNAYLGFGQDLVVARRREPGGAGVAEG